MTPELTEHFDLLPGLRLATRFDLAAVGPRLVIIDTRLRSVSQQEPAERSLLAAGTGAQQAPATIR